MNSNLTIEEKRQRVRATIVVTCNINDQCNKCWCAYVPVPTFVMDGWIFDTDYDHYPTFSCLGRYNDPNLLFDWEDCPLPDIEFKDIPDEIIEGMYNSIERFYLNFAKEAVAELYNQIKDIMSVYDGDEKYWDTCIMSGEKE